MFKNGEIDNQNNLIVVNDEAIENEKRMGIQ